MTYLIRFTLFIITSVLLIACSTVPERYQYSDDFEPDGHISQLTSEQPSPVIEPLSRRGNASAYEVFGKTYKVEPMAVGTQQHGIASWYGMKFHGHETSNGEIYDVALFTAAHKTLPLPCYVKVTRKDNQQSVIVRVNDRGPFHKGRIIDLSYRAAIALGIDQQGTAEVIVEVLTQPSQPTPQQIQVTVLSDLQRAQAVQQQMIKLAGSQWSSDIDTITRQDQSLYRVRLYPDSIDQNLSVMLERIQQQTDFKPIVVDS